jgi:hypothetical protein
LIRAPEGSHEGTDTNTTHHIDRDAGFVNGSDHAKVSSSSGTSSTQDQSNRFTRQQTSQTSEIRMNIGYWLHLLFVFQSRKRQYLLGSQNAKKNNIPSIPSL